MANKTLFQTVRGWMAPPAEAQNHEGAPAYAFEPEHALAQYVATGCMHRTFYASAEMQLERVLDLCDELDADYIARAAVYGRESGYMKDVPALLCAVLATRDLGWLDRVFPRVIDNGRMLRTFVQIMRSGVVGRKSFGSAPKRLIQEWLAARSDQQVFFDSVGNSPSMADVIKMVHPTPSTAQRSALYGYLLGYDIEREALPDIVQQFEAYKAGDTDAVPDVPFRMLTGLDLDRAAWVEIARNAPWHRTRMNLNTFARHGVFDDADVTQRIADRLRDPEIVRAARVFPYQILMVYRMTRGRVPRIVTEALQDAMEVATENVPAIDGAVYVCPDVSGSMQSAVTGHRGSATSSVRCIDVAALVTASLLRTNPRAKVLPFETAVRRVDLNPRDSVMTNADKLAAVGGGGTNCSAPLRALNHRKATGDLVVYVSDNESWVDARTGRGGTEMMRQWNAFKQRNPQARLVCLDVQPYATTQAADAGRDDILNIGGFSDQVFRVIDSFAAGHAGSAYFSDQVRAVTL